KLQVSIPQQVSMNIRDSISSIASTVCKCNLHVRMVNQNTKQLSPRVARRTNDTYLNLVHVIAHLLYARSKPDYRKSWKTLLHHHPTKYCSFLHNYRTRWTSSRAVIQYRLR